MIPDNLEARLVAVETKLDERHRATIEKIESGQALILEKLKALDEVKELRQEVDRHTRQISAWKGMIVLLGVAWTGLLSYFGLKHG